MKHDTAIQRFFRFIQSLICCACLRRKYTEANDNEIELEDDSKSKFLIHENGKFRTSWDIFVIILSIQISFTQPFDIAFEPTAFRTFSFSVFNYMTDVIFILDIIFNFRTTISDFITGEEIMSIRKITQSYIKGRFVLDLMAAIPFELLSQFLLNSSHIKKFGLFSILKIIRVLRFTKVISFLNTTESIKLSLRLFKLIFYLIMYLHW